MNLALRKRSDKVTNYVQCSTVGCDGLVHLPSSSLLLEESGMERITDVDMLIGIVIEQ